MLAIPAIDLKDGKVVCLVQGRYEGLTVYSHDPVEIAKTWQKQGAERLHIVDLDGARAGEVRNMVALRQIVENVNIPVQFGGGLRSREDIAAVLSIGVKWAILGTKPCEDKEFVKDVISEFGEQTIVSVDVKYGKAAARGWIEATEIEGVDLIKKMQEIGVRSFIYTDISRDGTMAGSNFEAIGRVLTETGASIIYSGGISSMEDIKELSILENRGLAGLIIGKALYEDKIHFTQVKTFLEKKE